MYKKSQNEASEPIAGNHKASCCPEKYRIPIGCLSGFPPDADRKSKSSIISTLPPQSNQDSSKSERDAMSSLGLYTVFRPCSDSQRSPTTQSSPRLCSSITHNDQSQNHEYYSRSSDFHGLRRFALDDNMRRAQYMKSKKEFNAEKADATESFSLPLLISARSNVEASDAPCGVDVVLDSEYVQARRVAPSERSGHFFVTQSNREGKSKPLELNEALRDTLDRHLSEVMTSLSTASNLPADKEKSLDMRHSKADSIFPHSSGLPMPEEAISIGPPTAFEVRRMYQHADPPIRSVKAVAERKRCTQSVLTSTRRIVPYRPEAEPSPRKGQAENLSEIEKWRVKMGLSDPKAIQPIYNRTGAKGPTSDDLDHV